MKFKPKKHDKELNGRSTYSIVEETSGVTLSLIEPESCDARLVYVDRIRAIQICSLLNIEIGTATEDAS
jgi:hypothetical protein